MFGDANYDEAGYTMGAIGAAEDEPSASSSIDFLPTILPGGLPFPIPFLGGSPFGGADPVPGIGPSNPFAKLFGGGNPPDPPAGTRELSTPEQVHEDIRLLHIVGIDVANTDHSLDPDFMRGIFAFQKRVFPRAGRADGLTGPNTRRVLREEVAKKTGVEPPPVGPAPSPGVSPASIVVPGADGGPNRLLLIAGGVVAAAIAAALLFGKKKKGKRRA